MNSLGGFVIDFGANLVTLESDINRAVALVDKSVGSINLSINKIGSNSNFNAISSSVERLTSQFDTLKNIAGAALAFDFLGGIPSKVMDIADQYTTLTNKIRTTTGSSAEFEAVQQQVFAIAQQTGQSLEGTASLYQRLEQTLESSGKTQVESQAQALQITKQLNESIAISGVSAGEASRAIQDLAHGLAGGVIHAQQLRPIMRQFPALAKEIADGLGVSGQQFEKMVHEGLSANDVLRSLAKSSDEIDKKFSELPKTFGRAWQELDNAVEIYVGSTLSAGTASNALKSTISSIAQHIPEIGSGVIAVGEAFAVYFGGKILASLGETAIQIKALAFAEGEYKTQTIVAAEAAVEQATALKQSLTATIAHADATNDLRIAEKLEIDAKVQSLASEQAILEARLRALPVGINIIATEERLAVVRGSLTASTARAVELDAALAASQAKVTLAENAEATATVRLAEAQTALTAAQTEAAAATGILSRAGSGLFALIGGWPTAIMATVAGLGYLITRGNETTSALEQLSQATDRVKSAHGALTPEIQKTAAATYQTAQAILQEKEALLAKAEAQAQADRSNHFYRDGLSDASIKAMQLAGEVDHLRDSVAGLSLEMRKAQIESFISAMKGAYNAAVNWKQGLLDAVSQGSGALDKQAEELQKHANEVGKTKTQILEAAKAQDILTVATKAGAQAGTEAYKVIVDAENKKYEAVLKAAKAYDIATAAAKDHGRAATQLTQDWSKLEQLGNKIAAEAAGPYVKAWEGYKNTLIQIDLEGAKLIRDHADISTVQQKVAEDVQAATDAYNRQIQAIREQHDALGQQRRDLAEAQQLLGVMPNEYDAVKAGLDAYNKALKDHFDLLGNYIQDEGELKQKLDEELPTYIKNQQALHDLDAVRRQSMQDIQDWVGIADSGFTSIGKTINDWATGGIKSSRDFFKSLKDDAKQTIASVLAEMWKLNVVRPLLASLFGGFSGVAGASGAGSLGNVLSGGGGGQSLLGNILGMFGGGGSSNTGTPLLNAGAGSDLLGSLGITDWSTIAPASTDSLLSHIGGIGGIASIAAAAFAGFNAFKGAGGGAGGLGAAGAYGLGTWALGSAATAGMGALGAGAGLGGAGSAALGAIGPVGWAALGAMALNSITGGGLFGTAWKPTGNSSSSFSVGDSGASLSTSIEESKKRMFFGGTKDRNVAGPVDPAAAQAAADFYNALQQQTASFAQQFGQTVGDIVGGTFKQTFDKSGKVTSQSDTVLGVAHNENQQQFQERLQADNILAVLDKLGLGASDFVASLQDDADKLFAATQDLGNTAAAIQADMKAGMGLMAAGTNADLKGILTFVEGARQAGETLLQTYQRMEQAQQQYQQFTAQFKPSAVYVDDFEAAMAQVNAQYKANIAQATALAKAAGLAGAKEEDLTNIHAYAAKQVAELIGQLKASAENLAEKLGYVDTLDSVNQQISELQSRSDQASQAVSGFGNSIQDTANAAKAAMDLLLGDLSPLNDKQKLQQARTGLASGTVTPEQYDAIARRLYASSQQYINEFNYAQQFVGRGAPSVSAVGGGGSASVFTAADQQRLSDLIKERDDMQAAQRKTDADRLAHSVAEYATATGESFKQAAQDMGFDLSKLGDDLGLKGDKLNDYLQGIADQKDSNKENTQSVIDTLKSLPDAIAAAIIAAIPTPRTSITSTQSMDSGDQLHSVVSRAVQTGVTNAVQRSSSRSDRYGMTERTLR